MFCKKCGEQMNGNSKFCPKCGTPVTAMPVSNGEVVMKPKPKKRIPYLAIGAGVLVIVVVCVAASILFGGGYKKTIAKFVEASEEGDVELMMSLLPAEYWYERGIDPDEVEDMVERDFDDLEDSYGENWKIEYEITDVRDLSDSQIQSLEEELHEIIDVKEAKEVKLGGWIYGDGNREERIDGEMTVIKVGRKWYISPAELW